MSLGLLTSTFRVINSLKRNTNQGVDKVSGIVQSRLVHNTLDTAEPEYLRRKKTRLELILLSCAVCGIEFCYAAETAFVTPILLQIGVPILYMSLIWGVSPLLGLILVPVLGSMSDNCKFKLGRRRPFILLLSTGIIIGLILVPNGETLGKLFGDKYNDDVYINHDTPTFEKGNFTQDWNNITNSALADKNSNISTRVNAVSITGTMHPWSVMFTMLGVVLLDFSCDACQSPCRAYMLDVCIPEDHHSGLSTFTLLAGAGGALGYVLGGINWEKTSVGEKLGGHVRVVFTLVLMIYIVCLCITISSFKEVPLSDTTKPKPKSKQVPDTGRKYKKFENESSSDEEEIVRRNNHNVDVSNGYGTIDTLKSDGEQKRVENVRSKDIEGSKHSVYVQDTVDQFQQYSTNDLNTEVSLKDYLKSIIHMPKSLVILCITNLFCWMSLVCYSLYFTDFVGQAVYGGDPGAPRGSNERVAYEQGVRLGSLAMSLYSVSCSIYSLNIERLVLKFGAQRVYVYSQLVYTCGALLMALTQHPVTVVLLSPASGVMYATLFTMPYLLVAHYHSQQKFSSEDKEVGSVRGLGTDVALVSSMVFLAQLLLSLFMGSLVHMANTTAMVMYTAAVLSFCGALAASQVIYMGL